MIYKIILDSYDTVSYSGNQYNAHYFINMNEVIKNPFDLDKQYIMDIQITSVATLSTESGFIPTILYGYNIDLGKHTNAYQFNNKHFNCSGVLRFENNFFNYSSVTAGSNSAYVTPLNIRVDDKNFYIGTLRDINYIKFQVNSVFDNTLFVSPDDSKSKYCIVLTFREINL